MKYKVEYYKNRIKTSAKICEKNRQAILDFLDSRKADGKTDGTIVNYSFVLLDFGAYISDKEFNQLTSKDITEYVLKISERLGKTTIELYKERICAFLRSINGGEKPDCIKGLKVNLMKYSLKPIKDADLPTDEDFEGLYVQARDYQTRALLFVHKESCARIGEILNANISDVSFDKYGAVLQISDAEGNKTGVRKIRLVNSAPILRQHLELHPQKNNPDAPLFLNQLGNRVTYLNHYRLIEKLANKCKMPEAKMRNLRKTHRLRHKGLTEMARSGFVSEYGLKEFAGWKLDSRQARRYLHGIQSDDMVLRMHGLKTADSKEFENKQKPVLCNNCKTQNPFDALFCYECQKPISKEGFDKFVEGKQQVRELLKQSAIAQLDKQQIRDVLKQVFKDEPAIITELIGQLPMAQVMAQFVRVGNKIVQD